MHKQGTVHHLVKFLVVTLNLIRRFHLKRAKSRCTFKLKSCYLSDMVSQQIKLISVPVPYTSILRDSYFQTTTRNTSISETCHVHIYVQYLKCFELLTCRAVTITGATGNISCTLCETKTKWPEI
jgi:hypothetical protein